MRVFSSLGANLGGGGLGGALGFLCSLRRMMGGVVKVAVGCGRLLGSGGC